ncbi:hypothetical protein EUGRSUZ_C04277, partial [Eucalyptus grandis]
MELAQMVVCKEADAQLIVPIFYDIDPADLKYQRGCVEESFSKHERRRIDRKVIYKWKQALGKITEMMGYDLRKTNEGHDVTDGLVGMEPHVREVMKKLGVIYVNEQATGVHDKDVRILGIWGMPEIGKTTLAKVVYNKIHRLFERCSFLSNIRENDFHALMYLEILVLEHCSALSQIDPLIGNLKNLVSLNLKFCKSVSKLPQELCDMKDLEELMIDGTAVKNIDFKPASMEKLKILSACQCKNLAHISDSIGHLESLVHLRLDGADIEQLPDSIKSLRKLRSLLLGNCEKLCELPPSIGNLESLEVMDLSNTQIVTLPRSIKHLKNLKVLKMEETHLRKFPKEIKKNIEKLEEIDLSKCWNLKRWILCDIRGLSSLKILRLSSTSISGLPWTLPLLSDLQQLDLNRTNRTFEIDGYNFPEKQIVGGYETSELLLGNRENLQQLPYSIGNLESLVVMDLSSTKIARLPRLVKHLRNLKVLKMEL